ncbi:PilW family protein [Marinobacter mangrovi]|uniref:PilW family protein n=1 Tax=Marinobacter mangrovi TaxID=2803918 RepID=UPI0019337F6E|nr:PilW family protein [Marinobacter mangrovi]
MEKHVERGLVLQSGLSIVELMVALVLGTLLTMGLVQIFTSNSQTFRLNEADARAQESGRMAVQLVSHALRNAGYFGCYPINPITNNLDSSDEDYDPGMYDFSFQGIAAENADRPTDAVDGTKFFSISGVRANSGIAATKDVVSASMEVSSKGGLKAGSIVMISDCEHGDIFEISSIKVEDDGAKITLVAENQDNTEGQPGNDFSANAPAACTVSDCLSASYSKGVRIRQPFNETYYIGSGPSGNALFFRNAAGNAVELVDNVIDMDIRFGEGSVNTGVQNWRENPADVSDWGKVIAVQASFLVRAGDTNTTLQPMSYCFPGWLDCSDDSNQTKAADRRLYRVYTQTTSLRNRID